MTNAHGKTILLVAGTRPEAIKLAPVLAEIRRRPNLRGLLCVTAQHRGLLDQVLQVFDLHADYDLDLMLPGQSLNGLASAIFRDMPRVFDVAQPDLVVVQGDTTTAFAAAMAAFYSGIAVGHVEAGLRTHDLAAPFPEEGNRRAISAIGTWHFAPTNSARDNLLREGVRPDRVLVTGNTVIDALLQTTSRLDRQSAASDEKLILVTGHRRESFGEGMLDLCRALRQVSQENPGVRIVYPVHPNPHVLEPVQRELATCPGIELLKPLDYLQFVELLRQATFVITDSGGVQEEAPALGKPVLVTRDVTERPEGVAAGCAKLVGTCAETIIRAANELLQDGEMYRGMARAVNPYGDGHAAERIVDAISEASS